MSVLLGAMKRVILLISLGFLIITACMVFLLKKGISLRPAVLIKPSVITDRMAQGVVARMFPEFDAAHYIVWGVEPREDHQRIFEELKKEYESLFHLNVNIMADAKNATQEQIKGCAKPCWVITTPENANELSVNPFIQEKIRPLQEPYSNISILPFNPDQPAPEHCLNEKRLSFLCLKSLAGPAAKRKIKTPQSYFFLKKYNHKDFFLFIQEPLK
jgi:hypothetical protein